MNRIALPRSQRGVTLIVGLIMLVLITLMVTTAFMLSNTNLKAVGNMQFRDEAVAAANAAIEEVLGSLLTGGSTVQPPEQTINVDLNNDGATDYVVNINPAPECIRSTELAATITSGTGSSASLGLPAGPPPLYRTIWDIDANVTDPASGASVRVHQGSGVMLTQAQKNAVCP